MIPTPEKACVKIGKIQRIATKMVLDLKDLTYKGREKGDLITIYELMNNLKEIDRKDLMLR